MNNSVHNIHRHQTELNETLHSSQPPSTDRFENLQSIISAGGALSLRDQSLICLPNFFNRAIPNQLLTLDLRNNNIKELDPRAIKNLFQLKTLDIRHNKIEMLPGEIGLMKNLTVLRADHNKLSYLPAQIGDLSSLEMLSAANNDIVFIPSTIGKLTNTLQSVHLFDNKIKYFPVEIGELSKLKALYIHGNRFISFPCSFMHLLALKELSLEWFRYATPPLPRVLKDHLGEAMVESLRNLCQVLLKHKIYECGLLTFLEHYSQTTFDPNCVDNKSKTALHNAAVEGDYGVIEGLLMSPNINFDHLDKENCTPLCLAIREDHLDIARMLIDKGSNVNRGGGALGSPLHMAVIRIEVWLVNDLIRQGADVNLVDNDGNSCLHLIMGVFSNNPHKAAIIAEALVYNGAKPNLKNNDNWTALHISARKGQFDGVKWILRHNEVLKGKDMELFDLNLTGGIQKWTALHLSGHAGHYRIVEDLLMAGADLFVRNIDGKTPRQCSRGNLILSKLFRKAEIFYLRNRIDNILKSGREANEDKKIFEDSNQSKLMYLTEKDICHNLHLLKTLPHMKGSSKSYHTFKDVISSRRTEIYNSLSLTPSYTTLRTSVAICKRNMSVLETHNNIIDAIISPKHTHHSSGMQRRKNFSTEIQSLNGLGASTGKLFNERETLKSILHTKFPSEKAIPYSTRAGSINYTAYGGGDDYMMSTQYFHTPAKFGLHGRTTNVFYLKDRLLDKEVSVFEKIEALSTIVYSYDKNPQQATTIMSILVDNLEDLSVIMLKLEVIAACTKIGSVALLEPLQQCLQSTKNTMLEEELENAIEYINKHSVQSQDTLGETKKMKPLMLNPSDYETVRNYGTRVTINTPTGLYGSNQIIRINETPKIGSSNKYFTADKRAHAKSNNIRTSDINGIHLDFEHHRKDSIMSANK